MNATTFKAKCLAMIDQVARDHVPVVVTKRGRPVARLVPLEPNDAPRSILGSVRLIARDDADYFSTGETWDAAR